MKRQTKHSVLLFVLFINLGLCFSCKNDEPKADLPSVEAQSAYDFYNSIGVGTHIGYGNTSYNDFERLTSLVTELGVKHIRDGFGGNITRTEQERRYKILGENGIKFLFCTGTEAPAALMPYIKRLLPYLSGVEGSNEVDYSYNKDVTKWLPISVSRQQVLYDSIHNNTETKNLPVINFSLADLGNVAKTVGDQSNKIDNGNLHIYAAAKHPANHWGGGLTEEQALANARIVSGSKPIIMTECGYHNYVASGQTHAGAPEEVSAIYFPHLLFEYFNNGIKRSYIYELLDQNPDAVGDKELHFGLVRYDGIPKPAFYAVKNLISLIADDKQITPSSLKFELKTGTELGEKYLRYSLLQKSNGSWWIALYRTNELFDTNLLITKNPISEKMTLNLVDNVSEINFYIPNESTDRKQSYNNIKTVEFELGSKLLLIEVKK